MFTPFVTNKLIVEIFLLPDAELTSAVLLVIELFGENISSFVESPFSPVLLPKFDFGAHKFLSIASREVYLLQTFPAGRS